MIEVDDKFENVQVKQTQSKPNIDKTYIISALSVIEENKSKKNSTVLRSEIEKLKTEINQSMGWDAFTKTDEFKKFNALRNQITKQRRS